MLHRLLDVFVADGTRMALNTVWAGSLLQDLVRQVSIVLINLDHIVATWTCLEVLITGIIDNISSVEFTICIVDFKNGTWALWDFDNILLFEVILVIVSLVAPFELVVADDSCQSTSRLLSLNQLSLWHYLLSAFAARRLGR